MLWEPPLAEPRRTVEYKDELGLGQPASLRRCTIQSFSVGVRGPQLPRAGAEGVELSHPGWRYRPDCPRWGRSRHPLRVRVMQMQTRERRTWVEAWGRRRSLRLGAGACASKALW